MNKYRFGYNTQEKDDEVYGKGNLNSAEFWMYDTRLGRRWDLDPVDQVSLSNYSVNMCNPIMHSDPNGDCPICGLTKHVANVVEAGLNWIETSHEQGIKNVQLAEHARQTAISQGRHDGDGINNLTKGAVYLSPFWFGGAKGFIDPFEDLIDLKNNLSQGNYVAAGFSAIFMLPGGDALKPIKSLVKSDKQLHKMAKETFSGNKILNKEANDLVSKYRKGLDGGIGGHSLKGKEFEGTGISELRGDKGARVYYRDTKDGGFEILGYSNKSNQDEVIKRIGSVYGNKIN